MITWREVFDQKPGVLWGHISTIQEAAKKAGYPYFLWNDRVYTTSGAKDMGLTAHLVRG